MKVLRSNDYINWIRTLPCIVCTMAVGYIPSMEFRSDPHHIPLKGHGGMGIKTDDNRTIPLCRFHHELYHQMGRESFEDRFCLDYEYIIKRLQEAYGRSMD